jgi:DNA-binding CsgD family transcriptional regulator
VRSRGWWRKGLTNGEIAECLVISPLSAETHVSNLLRTRLPRAALVALAYESGLLGRE